LYLIMIMVSISRAYACLERGCCRQPLLITTGPSSKPNNACSSTACATFVCASSHEDLVRVIGALRFIAADEFVHSAATARRDRPRLRRKREG
jgi:hypothetical protein